MGAGGGRLGHGAVLGVWRLARRHTRPPVMVRMDAISHSDDDVTASYGWSGGGGAKSTESWSITMRQSATRNGTYTNYRSATSSAAGSATFQNVARGKWYKASVTGCKTQSNCATVNTGALKAPTLTASLRATTTTITKGNSTEVEVHDVSPDNAALRIQHSSWLRRGSACATQQAGPAAVTIEYSFNGPRTFSFTGCGVGTHTVKLLPKVGSTALGTVSIRVEAKPPPPTTSPKVQITKVFPGTTGVYVEVSWNQTPPADLSELKLSWDQTSGFLCSKPKVSCEGERALATSSSAVTGYTVQNGKFVHDSDYTKFKVVAKGTGGATYEGHFRDNKGNDKFIRTHRLPELSYISNHGRVSEINGFKLFTLGEAGVKVPSSGYRYTFNLTVPEGSGLQVKGSGSSNPTLCQWGSWPREELSLATEKKSFYVVRCAVGNDSTNKLTLTSSATADGQTFYPLGTYAISPRVNHARHQADNTVKYVLDKSALEVQNPNDPGDIGKLMPDAVAWASRQWNQPNLGIRFCTPGSSTNPCGSDNTDGKTVTIRVVTEDHLVFTTHCLNTDSACLPYIDSRDYFVHIRDRDMFVKRTFRSLRGHTFRWTNDKSELARGLHYYLPTVIAHEFGHAAGLFHTSNVQVSERDVMYAPLHVR